MDSKFVVNEYLPYCQEQLGVSWIYFNILISATLIL